MTQFPSERGAGTPCPAPCPLPGFLNLVDTTRLSPRGLGNVVPARFLCGFQPDYFGSRDVFGALLLERPRGVNSHAGACRTD